MKTKTKFFVGVVAIMLSCVIMFTTVIVNTNTKKAGVSTATAAVRTVDISRASLDAQSVFAEFENVELETQGSKVSFSGTKAMDLSSLSEIDLIALDETFGENFKDVTYNLSVDSETSELEFSISLLTENNEIVTDTLNGIVITSETGKADALVFIEGETVLLSELCGENVLDNVGFFKSLWEAIKTVFKCTTEVLKVVVTVLEPVVGLLGGVVEIAALPFTAKKSADNYNNNINQKVEVDRNTGYITKQNNKGVYGNWKFGFGDIYNNGCGVIATYNALVFAGKITNDKNKVKDKDIDNYRTECFANLIQSYELTAGALIMGCLGINPGAITPMLKLHGVDVVGYGSFAGNYGFEANCLCLGKNQMAILCYWWTDVECDPPVGAHYVCITKNGDTYDFINGDDTTANVGSVSEFLHSGWLKNGFIKGWIITK